MVGNFSLFKKGTMRARALPLARALARRGHSVCLVLPALDAPHMGGTRTQIDGVQVLHVASSSAPGLRYPFSAVRVARAALADDPEVVHVFKPVSFAGALGAWVRLRQGLWLSSARLVVDADDWEGTGGWVDLERRPFWQRLVVDRQERWGLRHCDALTVASRHLQTLAWSAGVPPARVHYVPNGVDAVAPPRDQERRLAARGKIGIGGEPVVLLYTRFFEYPLERVVGVFRRISLRRPGTRLLVVGRGFWREEERLERMLAAAGLREAALFAGWVQAEELPTYFAAADLAIYPLADTLVNRTKCPAKLVELLAAGLPVVAERVGQSEEYIVHGVSGLLVPPGDDAAFAEAALALLDSDETRGAIGRQAAQRIAAHFLWEHLALRVEVAYGLRPQQEGALGSTLA